MADGWGDSTDDGWGSSTTSASGSSSAPTAASSSGGWGSGGGSDWGSGGGGGSSGGRPSTGGRGARNGGSSWGTKPGWGAGIADSSAPKERTGNLRVQSMVTVDRLSVDTLATDIRGHFGRFGVITRLVLDYRFDEDRVSCWLDFEKQESVEVSPALVASSRGFTW